MIIFSFLLNLTDAGENRKLYIFNHICMSYVNKFSTHKQMGLSFIQSAIQEKPHVWKWMIDVLFLKIPKFLVKYVASALHRSLIVATPELSPQFVKFSETRWINTRFYSTCAHWSKEVLILFVPAVLFVMKNSTIQVFVESSIFI